MKKLLITGAEGFTGQHVMRAASDTGYEIYPLHADLTDAQAIATEITAIAPTHVIHLAAISAVTHADELAIYRVNLFGTLHLLDALANLPKAPEKILLASSANVYGNTDTNPITESICANPVSHYAMSKLAMEHMATTYCAKLPIIFTRPFNYTGVGHDERFVIPKIIRHFAHKATDIELGNIDVEREFNDVRTVCDIYLKLLEHGQTGEKYNICSGNPIKLREVLSILEELTEHYPNITINPAFVRKNEIQTLCGSSAKLEATIGKIQHYSLRETLTWMLESSQ